MVLYEISIKTRGGLKVSDPRTVSSDDLSHVYLVVGTRSGKEWKTWKTWKLEEKSCKEWVSGSSYRLEVDYAEAGCVVILNRSFKGVGDVWYGAGLGNSRPLASNLTTELGGGVSLTLSRPSSCVGLPPTSIKPVTNGEMRFQTLHGSASYLCTVSQRSRPTEVLEIALGAWKTAIEMKVDISEMVNAFEGLTRAIQDQFDRGLKMETLGHVVSAMEKAAGRFSYDDQKSANLLNQLGTVQRIQFCWCPSRVKDILEAINYDRRALSIAEASSSPLVPAILHSLSLSLGRAYRFTSDPAFIEEALSLGRRAAVEAVQDHIHTLRLLDLGRLYISFFEDSGDSGHAGEAVQLFEMARSRAERAGDLGVVADALGSLGSALMARYTQMFDTADSSRGIEALRDALRLVLNDDSKRPRVMSELGRSLLVAWDSQNEATIQEAVSLLRQAIALTPEDDLELPTRLQGLAHALEWTFYRTMDPELISEAITLYELAIQIGGEATIPGERLLGVTRALGIRSMMTSEAVDVGEYCGAVNRSINSLRKSGGDWLRMASDLGVFWMERFRQDGILEDARRAASLFEDCLVHAPNNYVGTIALLGRLGLAYDAIFDVTQNIEDIDRAISAKRQGITLQPDEHTQRRCFFGSLAVSLQKHFKAVGKLSTIDEAIGHQEEILSETPDTHSGFRVWKTELARSFLLRPTSSLDEVYTKRLLGMIGHPDMLGWKFLPSYIDFPVRTKASGNLLARRDPTTYGRKKAVAYFRMSFLEPYGSTSERLRYAKLWEEQVHSFDIQSSQEGFDEAMGYIQGVFERRKPISQIQRDLSMASTVRCRGTAAYFQAGDLTKALQTLERNRCLIWRAVLNPASPFVGIKDLDRSLGERILEVSEGLEMAFYGRGGGGIADLFEEFKDLGWKASQLPNLEENLYSSLANNFRLPPSGTVVIVSVNDVRCDAIALTSNSEPAHIALPQFSYAAALGMVRNLRTCLARGGFRSRGEERSGLEVEQGHRSIDRYRRRPSNRDLSAVLRDLWVCVVSPILHAIGYTRSGVERRRIWWCPTGPLSFLPLHAAGIYSGPQSGIRDFAISSYIPSLTIAFNEEKLKRGRMRSQTTPGVLLISHSNVPHQPSLPGVEREIQAIAKVLDENTIPRCHLRNGDATTTNVQAKLMDYSCVHFACHASQHAKEPLQSSFLLHDGRLTISEVMDMKLKGAVLAFLSACQTSAGDDAVSEEVTHLAAVMLAAGYQGVVGTTWSILDSHAPFIAEEFYHEFTRLNKKRGLGVVDPENAGEALHYAVGRLRERLGDSEDALMAWIPYVHFGI